MIDYAKDKLLEKFGVGGVVWIMVLIPVWLPLMIIASISGLICLTIFWLLEKENK